LYLEKRLGTSSGDFPVILEIWEADEDGIPTILVGSSSKDSSEIITTDWHLFSFDLPAKTTPSSGLLTCVFYQDGGDEENYIAWFYSSEDNMSALCSSDGGTTWSQQRSVSRSMKVMRESDPFEEAYDDSTRHVLTSSPGTSGVINSSGSEYLEAGQFSVGRSGPTRIDDDGDVVIDHQQLFASLVIDSSGSMGWNDRAKRKIDIAIEIINRLKDEYPADTVFDIIKVGANQLGAFNTSFSQQSASVTLDASIPTRTTTNEDGSIPSITDTMAAFGFSGLEPGHTYIISEISTETTVIEDGEGIVDSSLGAASPVNFQSVGAAGSGIGYAIQPNGPNGINATVAITPASGGYDVRKPFAAGRALKTTPLTDAVLSGSTTASVEAPDTFSIGDTIDLIDSNGLSVSHEISAIDATPGGEITFSPETTQDIASGALGGFMQDSSSAFNLDMSGTTNLFIKVKDEDATGNITFYLQTIGGGTLEWDLFPFSDWETRQAVFIDRPAVLSVDASDLNGDSFGPDAEIHYFVDSKPTWSDNFDKNLEIALDEVTFLAAGTDEIVLPTVDDVDRGDYMTLVTDTGTRITGFEVKEIDFDSKTVIFFPPLSSDESIASVVFEDPPSGGTTGDELDMLISAVDVSPMDAGRSIDPGLLEPTDPEPVPSTETNFDAFNEDEDRWQHRSFDVPLVRKDGDLYGVASIRILPITEDQPKSISEKQEDLSNLSSLQTLTDEERQELDALEDAYLDLQDEVADSTAFSNPDVEVTAAEEPNYVVGSDYRLDPARTPVGATSSLTSSAQTLGEEDWGRDGLAFDMDELNSADGGTSKMLSKSHTVNYALVLNDDSGNPQARHLLGDSLVYFVSPVQIYSRPEEGKDVLFEDCCCTDSGETIGFSENVPGVVASAGESIDIDYVVYNRGAFLPSGTLTVKIYDRHRTEGQIEDPMSIAPNLKGEICPQAPNCDSCSNSFDLDEFQFSQFSKSTTGDGITADLENGGGFLQEATYLDGYTKGGISITITEGKASVTIPATPIVARLLVVAEIEVPGLVGSYVARFDDIWIDNPVKMTLSIPGEASSGFEAPLVPVGASLTYLGVPVSDNVEVEFSGSSHARFYKGNTGKIDPNSSTGQGLSSIAGPGSSAFDSVIADTGTWKATEIVPSVGKTVNGATSGVLMGPHPAVTMHVNSLGELRGDTESITAASIYNGYQIAASGSVEWTSLAETDDDLFIFVHFYKGGAEAGGSVNIYADGWDNAIAVADIPESVNGLYEGLDRDTGAQLSLLGYDKDPVLGRRCSFSIGAPLPGRELRFYDTQPIDPDTGAALGGTDTTGSGNVGWAAAIISNSFAPTTSLTCEGCCPTECEELISGTFGNLQNGDFASFRGCGSGAPSNCLLPDGDGGLKTNLPMITWVEPLTSSFEIDGSSTLTDFIRDGAHETLVEVEVMFSGEAIPFVAERNNVRNADGSKVGFPSVIFDIYYLKRTTNESGIVISEEIVRDQTLSLTDAAPLVALSKTTDSVGHYHRSSVDEDGNGVTTTTLLSSTVTETDDHVHVISNYVVEDALDADGVVHSHDLRSIATTTIRPISDQSTAICIDASVSYDASRSPVERTVQESFCTTGLSSSDYWTMDLVVPQTSFATEDVTIEDSGFTCQVILRHFVDQVEVAVSDGERVSFSLKGIKESVDDDSVPTFGEDEVRRYISVDIESAAVLDGSSLSKNGLVKISSDLDWLPDVRALFEAPTDDSIYIEEALTSAADVIGSSQINDGLFLAANRMLEWQSTSPSRKEADRMVFLISDGDENESEKSASQAINRFGDIAGAGQTPVNVILSGDVYSSDISTMKSLASETGGSFSFAPIGFPVGKVSSLVEGLISSGFEAFNEGTYSNSVDLGGVDLIEKVLLFIEVPEGASVSFRARFSDDGTVYGSWTSEIVLTASGEVSIDSLGRYMQYEIGMKGNEFFESPSFSSIRTSFITPGTETIFFQPILLDADNDSYMGEIAITHEATVPDRSTIEYGIVHSDSVDFIEYSSSVFPLVQAGDRAIILPRSNESTSSSDGFRFSLVNGPWPEGSTVEVFRYSPGEKEGELIAPSLYSSNAREGSVTFTSLQASDSRILVTIGLPSVVRIACRITNRDLNAASIDHIGLMYNVTKRIERDSEGKIVRQPIDMRVDESSSSSQSISESSESSESSSSS
jgi:hypothetical protein